VTFPENHSQQGRADSRYAPRQIGKRAPLRYYLLATTLFLIAASPAALADHLRLTAFQATNNSTEGLASKFDNVAGCLDSWFGFSSYKVIDREKVELEPQREAILKTKDGSVLTVIVESQESRHYQLTFSLKPPGKKPLKATVRMAKHSPILVRGPQNQDGRIVFLLNVE